MRKMVEEYNPSEPAPRRWEIHGLIDQYVKDAQARNKKPLRLRTAKDYKYILVKWVADCGISRVGDITVSKIDQWLLALKSQEKAICARSRYILSASAYS